MKNWIQKKEEREKTKQTNKNTDKKNKKLSSWDSNHNNGVKTQMFQEIVFMFTLDVSRHSLHVDVRSRYNVFNVDIKIF